MTELRICPCGNYPDSIEVEDERAYGSECKAYPSCCNRWIVEFSNKYTNKTNQELAEEAWNNLPRYWE